MKLTIDFETRSTVELVGKKSRGAAVYAEDPSTDILCMAIKLNDNPPVIWVPNKFQHIVRGRHSFYGVFDTEVTTAIEKADTIEAHNIFFETSIWHHIMHKRYGFPDLPKDKIRCSAAKAAAHSLPRGLGGACDALGVEQRKDKEGYKIMMKMCKPRRVLKADKEMYPDTWKDLVLWHEDPEEFAKLCDYCRQDVEAEHSLSEALDDLPPDELEMFLLDQRINNTGVKVDVPAIDNIKAKVNGKEAELLAECSVVTNGEVSSTRKVAASLTWLKREGVGLPNFQKETVNLALKRKDLSVKARRLLQIRQSLGKSSVAKLDAMKRWANKDGRVRGAMLYHGANTGRWAGKGIQPQNYPRDSYYAYDINRILDHPTHVEVDEDYGCSIKTASACLRGMITCEPGNTLYCADFSSIEARVLAWLAGEEKILDNFRNGLDAYKVAASAIFDNPYEKIIDDERKIGKVSELACGFGGGVNAFVSMAPTYGVYVEKKRARQIVKAWRADRPETVAFWAGVENAAVSAIQSGLPHSYNGIIYEVRGRFLKCRLHSGRELSYCDPETKTAYVTNHACKNEECENFWNKKKNTEHPRGDVFCPECGGYEITYRKYRTENHHVLEHVCVDKACRHSWEKKNNSYPTSDISCPDCGTFEIETYTAEKEEIRFMGVDSYTTQWQRQFTYGGKLTENIVQAEARDLLRDALIRLGAAGYKTVMHCHDEALVEVAKGSVLTYENMEAIMVKNEPWSTGIPLGASGWVGERYRK